MEQPSEAVDEVVSENRGDSRRGWFDALVISAFGLLVGGGFYMALSDDEIRAGAMDTIRASPGELYRLLGEHFFLNPWFYVVFLAVLGLERLIPAKEEQPQFNEGVKQDLLWAVLKLAAQVTALPLYVIFLQYVYDNWLGFLTIHAVVEWPWLARLTLAVLVGDFMFWVSHYLRHEIRALWYFHAVHHSQKEMNFFTEYRVHPIDDLFIYTIGFIPLFMVNHSFVTLVGVVWIRHWHTRLYHSNIRSDFGPLRYVLVTPQSHRVHHSIEPHHRDMNFGLTFSIWDQMFGTQYRGWDEYPETGIDDDEFPFEQTSGARLGHVGRLIAQFLYPFRALARD